MFIFATCFSILAWFFRKTVSERNIGILMLNPFFSNNALWSFKLIELKITSGVPKQCCMNYRVHIKRLILYWLIVPLLDQSKCMPVKLWTILQYSHLSLVVSQRIACKFCHTKNYTLNANYPFLRLFLFIEVTGIFHCMFLYILLAL